MGSHEYSNEERMAIYLTDVICASLSIVGCCFILTLCFFFPNLRRLPFRMIIYLTIADLGSSISFVLPYFKSNYICQVQGFMNSYFPLSSIMWCACISHAIKSAILYGTDVKKNVVKYFIIGFFLPSLSFLVLIDIKEYKPALGWCWIYLNGEFDSEFYKRVAYRFLTFYIPLFVVVAFIIYNYLKITKELKYSESLYGTDKKVTEAMILKLRLYPIILVVALFPVSLLRIISLGLNPPWELTLVSGIGVGINGFLNSVVYGLTQEVRNELSKKFIRIVDDDKSSSLVQVE